MSFGGLALRLRLPLLFSAIVVGGQALAYPSFVRLGYTSCTGCHVSPRGGGSLTEYGRGIQSSVSLFSREYSPSQSWIAKVGTLNGKVSHELHAREIGYSTGKASDLMFMQLDYLNSTSITDTNRVDLTLGYAVQSTSNTPIIDRVVLRKAMYAYRPHDGLEISAGRDFLPAGLNIPDHTSFLRSENRRGVTDYPTQLRVDGWSESFQWTPYLFIPSFQEPEGNKEYGAGVRVERALKEDKSVGLTALYGKSTDITRTAAGAFAKIGLTEKIGVLSEYQFTRRSVLATDTSFGQHVVYTRAFYSPLEWIDAGLVGEYLARQLPFPDRAFQYGPNIYLRMASELTLVMDASFLSRGGTTEPTYLLQAFAHL